MINWTKKAYELDEDVKISHVRSGNQDVICFRFRNGSWNKLGGDAILVGYDGENLYFKPDRSGYKVLPSANGYQRTLKLPVSRFGCDILDGNYPLKLCEKTDEAFCLIEDCVADTF